MKKILLLTILFTTLLWPSISNAQTDQRCWRQQDCIKSEGKLYGAGTFIQNAESTTACSGKVDAVGNQVGFCLPITVAETAVSFGGKSVFNNVAEFFKYIYEYGIRIAGILSVLMLIVGGVQWLLSAGSPDKIGSAKKRISGAIIGLVIILVSFALLNILNPYLVQLRLPNVWMINERGLTPPSCAQAKKPLEYYKTDTDKEKSDAEKKTIIAKGKFSIPASQEQVEEYLKKNPTGQEYVDRVPTCGHEYFVKDAGAVACSGYICQEHHVCVPYEYDKKGEKIEDAACWPYVLRLVISVDSAVEKIKAGILGGTGGTLAGSFLGIDKLNSPKWYGTQGDWLIYGVCEDYKLSTNRIKAYDFADSKHQLPNGGLLYIITYSWKKNILDKISPGCGSKKLIGLLFMMDIDETGTTDDYNLYVGRNKEVPNKATGGVWKDINIKENYFPLDTFGSLHGENFYEMEIDNSMITRFREDKNSVPPGSFKTISP
ncbi:MAG: pilin [Candidatus Magasanikbacteria bacterium]